MTAPSGGWELVTAAQAGDREAFGALYRRYAPVVSRVLASRTGGDRVLVEDLTSETFLRGLRGIGSLRSQLADPGAWFTTIARNLFLDHVRSSRHKLEQVTADVPDRVPVSRGDSGPERAVLEKETVAELRRQVAALSPDQQECLARRFVQESSVAETAAAMDRAEGAVKSLQHRAVTRLRASLTEETEPVAAARAGPDPVARARDAVSQVAREVARGQGPAEERCQPRAGQLARWHTDDREAHRATGTAAMAGSAEGGAG